DGVQIADAVGDVLEKALDIALELLAGGDLADRYREVVGRILGLAQLPTHCRQCIDRRRSEILELSADEFDGESVLFDRVLDVSERAEHGQERVTRGVAASEELLAHLVGAEPEVP